MGRGPKRGNEMVTTREQVERVIRWARDESADEACTKYANATVQLVDGELSVRDIYVSDWFVTGSTVACFTNGEQVF